MSAQRKVTISNDALVALISAPKSAAQTWLFVADLTRPNQDDGGVLLPHKLTRNANALVEMGLLRRVGEEMFALTDQVSITEQNTRRQR